LIAQKRYDRITAPAAESPAFHRFSSFLSRSRSAHSSSMLLSIRSSNASAEAVAIPPAEAGGSPALPVHLGAHSLDFGPDVSSCMTFHSAKVLQSAGERRDRRPCRSSQAEPVPQTNDFPLFFGVHYVHSVVTRFSPM